MNKSELIQALAERYNMTPKDAEKVTDLFFEMVTQELASSGRVEIRGFGNFVLRQYGSYVGRNPKTGDKVSVPEKKLPYWKTGKELHERVNSAKKKAAR